MIQTGVASTDWRRSARRNLLLRSDVSAMRVFDALRDHHLEAALDLRVARALECGQRGITVQIHLALQRRASALGAGFAVQRPAAKQILLQRDAAIARRAGNRRDAASPDVVALRRQHRPPSFRKGYLLRRTFLPPSKGRGRSECARGAEG